MENIQANILQELGENQLPKGPLIHILESELYGDGLIIELGTGDGKTTKLISSHIKDRTLHTFDWFKGRPNDWRQGYSKGQGSRNGSPPQGLPGNVTIHVGEFLNTCKVFAKEHVNEKAALIYVDCDIYLSTKQALDGLSSLIHSGTIIVFDELINYPGYEEHELKAFVEFLKEHHKEHKTLGGFGGINPVDNRYRSNWRNQKGAFYVYDKSSASSNNIIVNLNSNNASSSSSNSSKVESYSNEIDGGLLQRSATIAIIPQNKISNKSKAHDLEPEVKQSIEHLEKSNDLVSNSNINKGDKKVKLVVAYGRRQFFRALLPYILRELNVFDEIILWKNTKNSLDLKFLDDVLNVLKQKGLSDKFKPINPDKPNGKGSGVFPVYRKLNDQDTLYIKIDDDVVWVTPNGFESLIKFALENEHNYAVFSANVINSGPPDVLHQRKGASASGPILFKESNPYDKLLSSAGAAQVHESLQKSVENGTTDKYIVNHVYLNNPRWSINCIAFFGYLFNNKDYSKLELDDERYISRHLSKSKNKSSAISGESLMAHYSFDDQRTRRKIPGRSSRSTFGKDVQILSKYVEWAEALYK